MNEQITERQFRNRVKEEFPEVTVRVAKNADGAKCLAIKGTNRYADILIINKYARQASIWPDTRLPYPNYPSTER